MIFLHPFFLAFAPLVFLPMLLSLFKTKREQKIVPSTRIWLEVIKEQKLNSPFKKYLTTLEMILQMLLITLLILGLSRPSFKTKTNAKILLFVDISASLSAKNGVFSRVKSRILDTLKKIPSGAKYSLYLAGQKLHPLLIDEHNVESVISKIGVIHPYPDTINLDNISEEIKSVIEMQKDKEQELIAFFFTDNNCDKKELEQLQEELKTKKIIFNITTSASKGGNIGIFNVRETTSASGKLILNFDIGNFSNTPCEISLKLQANSPSGDRILNRKEFIILSGNSTKSFNKSISLRQSAKLHIFFSVIDGENHIECDDGFGTTFTYNKNRQGVYIGSRKYFPYFKKIFHIKNWNIAYYKNIPVNIKLPYPPIWIFHNSFNQNSLKFLTKNSFFMVFGNSPFLKSTPVNADRIVTFNGTHPFLRFCDFSDLSINTPYSINNSFPELDESILATTGNQNIIALLTNSVAGRILAFSFSLNSSNFLKTLSFPIMMENIYDFLKMKKGEVLLYYTGQKWFDANGEIPYLIPGNEKLFFKAINLLDDTESDINSNNKLAFNNSGVISRMKELFHQEIADIILYIVLFFLLFESFIRFIKKRRYIK